MHTRRLDAALPCRYAEECQTPLGGWGLDAVLRSQAWKLRGKWRLLPLLMRMLMMVPPLALLLVPHLFAALGSWTAGQWFWPLHPSISDPPGPHPAPEGPRPLSTRQPVALPSLASMSLPWDMGACMPPPPHLQAW